MGTIIQPISGTGIFVFRFSGRLLIEHQSKDSCAKTRRSRNDARTGCKTAQDWHGNGLQDCQTGLLNPNVTGLFVPGVIQRVNYAITSAASEMKILAKMLSLVLFMCSWATEVP